MSARLTRLLLGLAGAVATVLYLFQHSRIGPNHVDGGLLLGYLQTIADGGLPYYDFLDVYGLASWPLPALFYVLAGQKVWGLRLWLVVIKLVALLLCFGLVRRLADRVHAAFATLLLTLLLGLPWQLLQTTYAFLPALALELAVAYLLLGSPAGEAGPGLARLALAGVLIGLTLCVKLNSGALLWAGAMFAAFFMPLGSERCRRALFPPTASDARARRLSPLVRALQWLGLAAYAVAFHLFMRAHYHALYAVYLSLPLLLLLAWTARHLPSPELPIAQLRAWGVLFLVPPLSALALLGAYLGGRLSNYLRDTSALLAHLSYVAPVPPLGKPGQYVGFNEFYWPQFPWLITAVFVLWWWRAGRSSSRVPPLYALYVCNLFVMYSRTDESHLHQSMLFGVPLLWVMWAELCKTVPRPGAVQALAWGFTAFACYTLGTRPSSDWLQTRGDWQTPRLAGIHYHRQPDPYVRPFQPGVDMRRWDQTVDLAALYLRQRLGEGADVLMLGRNELLAYAAHAVPAGGRFRYLFYLVKNDHFGREDFLAVGGPGALESLRAAPPAAIVSAYGDQRMVRLFPEIRALLEQHYDLVAKFGHLSIFVFRGANDRPGEQSKPAI